MGKEQERIKELIGATESKMILAYDEVTAAYQGTDLKKDLLEFLEKEQATKITGFVASTLYFHTSANTPLKYWSDKLIKKFGRKFKFSLAVIEKIEGRYQHIDYPQKSMNKNIKGKMGK